MQGPAIGPEQLPQPPDPQQTQMLQPAGGPTLGDVNQAAAPGNPVMNQYADNIQGMLQQLQPFMEQPKPPQQGPGLLESLATFGIANLKHIADENTRREENYRILQRNRQIGMKGVDLAVKATDAQATAAGLAARQGIAMQHLTLDQQKFINDLIEQKNTQARLAVNDNFKFNTIPVPMGVAAMTTARAAGYGPDPTGQFGGRWVQLGAGGAGAAPTGTPKLTGSAATGWSLPANAPMAHALGQVAMDPNAAQPGEQPEDVAAAKIAKQKGAESAATEKGKNAAALTASIGQLRGELDTMQAATAKVLPSLGQGGVARGLATTYIGGPVSILHARYSSDPKLRDAAKTLSTSARNIFNLIKSEAGGTSGLRITNAEIQQFGKQFNAIAAGRTNLEDAQTYIDNLRAFLDRRDPSKGADVDATTTSTPTSTTPPSTGAPTQPTGATGVTPSGIRFRVVQ